MKIPSKILFILFPLGIYIYLFFHLAFFSTHVSKFLFICLIQYPNIVNIQHLESFDPSY